jgi:sec-independent protein translocase protein TatC
MNHDPKVIQDDLGGQMSFLDHLDELRRRIVRSVMFIVCAFVVCFYFSGAIFDFLSVPIRRALSEAERRELPVQGRTGEEKTLPLSSLKVGESGIYVFDRATRIGSGLVQPGTAVNAIVAEGPEGKPVLYTEEIIITANSVIPAGVLLPVDLSPSAASELEDEERMIVTTAQESFMLYVTVSLYAAIALSIPFLLLQVWGFISPGLYKHERSYVTPFILLSTISFAAGAAFAYYILFPPAARYLLGLGEDFRLLLRASDYFDLITLIMLAMGFIFQMPAIAYVLSRIGLISAGFLLRSWKIAIVIILIVAAVISPTGDAVNLMLFSAPMMALYVVSIGIAWFFGRKRRTDAEMRKIS